MLRTPSAIEGQGGAISEKKSREKNRMLQVRDQMAQLAAENGLKVSDAIAKDLLPTPNTMEHLPPRTGEARERQLHRGNSTSRRSSSGNLREDILELLPTPALGHIRNYDEPVEDYLARRKKMEDGEYKGMPGVSLGVALRMELMPTPIVRDYKDGSAEVLRDGQVQTDTVARAIFNSGEVLLGTPRTSSANGATSSQIAAGAPKARLEDQVHTTWGKFEPAIHRWEKVIHRSAPEPTKPDGKEGSHRLSSRFTEWMMGLPDGWITDVGLSRVDELKACGNGVVPQQAELALKILLQGVTVLDDIE
jgi:DNA (cytosine-5)-methyltransferase 1